MNDTEDTKSLCFILVKIAENCINNLPILQYVFIRMEEILGLTPDVEIPSGDITSKRAVYFANDQGLVPSGPFLRGMQSGDALIQRSAACVYACLLVYLNGDLNAFVSWLMDQFHHAPIENLLPPLCMIMRKEAAREALAKANGINLIVAKLFKIGVNGNAQHIYELTFCLWTISLDRKIDQTAFLSSGVIRILADLLASAPSRKVVRMALATLHNLASVEHEGVVTEMLTSGLQRLLESMIRSNSHTQGGDPEVEADVKALSEVLLKNFRELSTFERWVSEIQSGALRWGVVHTEKFWRENAKLLEADDFKLLKQLIALLRSDDPVRYDSDKTNPYICDLGYCSDCSLRYRRVHSILPEWSWHHQNSRWQGYCDADD